MCIMHTMTVTASEPREASGVPARMKLIVVILSLTGIVVSLAQTMVVPIIGSLPAIFETSAANTSWIVTVTLLAGAVATTVLGRLADMYGKKRMLLIAVLPFMIGSVICALATDLGWMITGRGLQGLASGIVPLGISLLHDVLPRRQAGSAIAMMSSSMGIGGALGLPIAAAVSQFADWRVLFWSTAAASVLVMAALWAVIPAGTASRSTKRFDFLGAAGLAIWLSALLLGVSKGGEWGWGSAANVGLLAGAAVVSGAWAWYQLRCRSPLVDLRIAARPAVLLTNLASILLGFAMYAMNLVLPQVMQLPVELGFGLGQSMLQMGLWLAPMGLGMMAVATLGAWISRSRGPKTTLSIAGVVIAAGYAATALILATLGNRSPEPADSALILWTLILLAFSGLVTGCGVGLAYGSMPALIIRAVPASQKAAANGFNSLMRGIGTTTSAALIGVILASMTQLRGGQAIPTVDGFIICLLIGGTGALLAAGIAAAIPAGSKAAAVHAVA